AQARALAADRPATTLLAPRSADPAASHDALHDALGSIFQPQPRDSGSIFGFVSSSQGYENRCGPGTRSAPLPRSEATWGGLGAGVAIGGHVAQRHRQPRPRFALADASAPPSWH